MKLFGENPVLQRELLVNLRTFRSFLLLFVFQLALCTVVVLAWPGGQQIDLTSLSGPDRPLLLADLFFLGNFVLASLMAPSFAAGAIAGEKERKTQEMLLASPLHPAGIVWGKLVAALTHLSVLVFSSLPVVLLCLPLGGVSPWEVFAAYLVLICALVLFGTISLACGAAFRRTSAALVVAYLLILPLVLLVVVTWHSLRMYGLQRVYIFLSVFPGLVASISIPLFFRTAARLLYPSDLGQQGQEVIDPEREADEAVGLVINRDQFPDRLFAPPIRPGLMPDRTNPVFDKEMRSEIFGQGTLMLRLAIQISLILAIIPMAICLYIFQSLAPWYICYVLLFNLLVGPVFSAGSITSERERQTLDLLLTTTVTPWQIMWGKLLSGLRVSGVLTGFLMWPVVLALCTSGLFRSPLTVAGWFLIVLLTCVTTSTLAMFCSCLCRRTVISLLSTYIAILALYLLPPALYYFFSNWFGGTRAEQMAWWATVTSPFMAAHELPLGRLAEDLPGDLSRRFATGDAGAGTQGWASSGHFFWYLVATACLNVALLSSMIWMFRGRWRLASSRG